MISTGWLLGSAAPSEVYNAPLRQALLFLGAVTILLLATSGTLGAYFGRRLIDAINVLKGEAIALGDTSPHCSQPLSEKQTKLPA